MQGRTPILFICTADWSSGDPSISGSEPNDNKDIGISSTKFSFSVTGRRAFVHFALHYKSVKISVRRKIMLCQGV
jgi:hypothetical protein